MKSYIKYIIGSAVLMIIFLLMNDIFGMSSMVAAGMTMIIFELSAIKEKLDKK